MSWFVEYYTIEQQGIKRKWALLLYGVYKLGLNLLALKRNSTGIVHRIEKRLNRQRIQDSIIYSEAWSE